MTVDVTIGTPTANSYNTTAEVDAYVAGGVFNPGPWTALSQAQKDACVLRATRLLDTLVTFRGTRVTDTQARQWPRYGVPTGAGGWATDFYAGYYPIDQLPIPLKNAHAELANYLATQITATTDVFGAPDSNGVSRLAVGPVTLDFDASRASADGITFFNAYVAPILEAGNLVTIGARLTR